MIPFRYSPSGILTAVHPRVAALAVLSWLLVVGVAAAQPEATEPQTLSLDDLAALDALLEEDSDAAVAVLDRGAVGQALELLSERPRWVGADARLGWLLTWTLLARGEFAAAVFGLA